MENSSVINLQRSQKIDLASIKAFVVSVSDAVNESSGRHFTVAFIPDDRMKQLNELFRGVDATTDVLSFPHEPDEFETSGKGIDADGTGKTFLGDIVISTQQAQKQAAENGLTLHEEIKQLILHGLLHLCGYDHETDDGAMNARELELRETLGI